MVPSPCLVPSPCMVRCDILSVYLSFGPQICLTSFCSRRALPLSLSPSVRLSLFSSPLFPSLFPMINGMAWGCAVHLGGRPSRVLIWGLRSDPVPALSCAGPPVGKELSVQLVEHLHGVRLPVQLLRHCSFFNTVLDHFSRIAQRHPPHAACGVPY